MENDKEKDNEAFPLRFSLFHGVPPFLRLVDSKRMTSYTSGSEAEKNPKLTKKWGTEHNIHSGIEIEKKIEKYETFKCKYIWIYWPADR